jgi:hypothetical protein
MGTAKAVMATALLRIQKRFRKLGLIELSGGLRVNSALLRATGTRWIIEHPVSMMATSVGSYSTERAFELPRSRDCPRRADVRNLAPAV